MSADAAPESSAGASSARFRTLALATLGAYALLVGLHRGEFFPFSIFAMFSGAGRAWVRATVRELPGTPTELRCTPLTADQLPGEPFPIRSIGLDQNDLSKLLLAIGDPPTATDLQLLERMFDVARRTKHLVIYRARGAREPDGSVQVRYRALAAIGPSETRTVAECPP